MGRVDTVVYWGAEDGVAKGLAAVECLYSYWFVSCGCPGFGVVVQVGHVEKEKVPLNWPVVCGYAHTHPLDCYGSLHFQYHLMKFIS